MNYYRLILILATCLFFSACSEEAPNSGTNKSSSTATKPASQNTSGTYTPSVQTSLGIVLPTVTAGTGDEICLDVTVKDFNKIVSIQHSINWDTKVLKFNKLQNFNLKGMSEASFGTTNTEKGYIAVSWYDPAIQGFTLTDGTKIYEACFQVIGASGTNSSIRITGDPVPVEVSTVNQRILGIPTGKGKVSVK